MKKIYLLIALITSCNPKQQTLQFTTADLNYANRTLLEIAMVDGFSPPVASRVYVYPHIAFYVVLQQSYPDSLKDIGKFLTDFPNIDSIQKQDIDPELSALLCFAKVAKALVFSENKAEQLIDKWITKANALGIPENKIKNSIEYANSTSNIIIAWIKKDNYLFTRTQERFTSTKKPENWRETPSDYTPGLEPHWNSIRRLFSDTSNSYQYVALPTFSMDKKSEFYKTVTEVFQQVNTQDSSQIKTALYWDDNPNVSKQNGHLNIMIHKISPPGHWLNIISQISQNQNSNIFITTKAYTYASIAMFDGIIECWKIKYKTDVVRPISYILDQIDQDWRPIIQTPPFPEFTSGHSVVSAAAAEVLSTIYGNNFSFIDSTEILFGHPARKFNSFHEAAMEVSMSRFFGGIHYKHSVLEGNKEGIYIAKQLMSKIN
ncbi:MAG: vanadium-dependent haloperoxidase [Saprospiraceae bacterium]